MPRSKEDDAARKRKVAATVDDPVAVEAATLGAAITVAAAVDDPVAVETAQRVLQHPWGQRDSIMPRSKEDDAARKREERLARSADDAAARSAVSVLFAVVCVLD